MNRSCVFAVAGLACLLLLCSCVGPQEDVFASQREANWREAPPEAITAAKDALPPDIRAETFLAAGALFEGQGNIGKAIAQYRQAIARDPKCARAYNRLGILLGKIGHHRDAEEMLRRAVELVPESASLRNNLGYEYLLQERWADAEAELRNSIRLRPGYRRAHINLGVALCKQKCYEEGLAEFEEALPQADALYNFGLMLRSAGRWHDAAEVFRQTLRVDPRLTAAKTQLVQIVLRLEDDVPPVLAAQIVEHEALAGSPPTEQPVARDEAELIVEESPAQAIAQATDEIEEFDEQALEEDAVVVVADVEPEEAVVTETQPLRSDELLPVDALFEVPAFAIASERIVEANAETPSAAPTEVAVPAEPDVVPPSFFDVESDDAMQMFAPDEAPLGPFADSIQLAMADIPLPLAVVADTETEADTRTVVEPAIVTTLAPSFADEPEVVSGPVFEVEDIQPVMPDPAPVLPLEEDDSTVVSRLPDAPVMMLLSGSQAPTSGEPKRIDGVLHWDWRTNTNVILEETWQLLRTYAEDDIKVVEPDAELVEQPTWPYHPTFDDEYMIDDPYEWCDPYDGWRRPTPP